MLANGGGEARPRQIERSCGYGCGPQVYPFLELEVHTETYMYTHVHTHKAILPYRSVGLPFRKG